MKYYKEISCPHCNGTDLGKAGKSASGVQRFFCKNDDCKTHTFMLKYCYKACESGMKEKIIEMAINASGIRDTARVLGIDKNTVISQLKKKKNKGVQVNPNFQPFNDAGE